MPDVYDSLYSIHLCDYMDKSRSCSCKGCRTVVSLVIVKAYNVLYSSLDAIQLSKCQSLIRTSCKVEKKATHLKLKCTLCTDDDILVETLLGVVRELKSQLRPQHPPTKKLGPEHLQQHPKGSVHLEV